MKKINSIGYGHKIIGLIVLFLIGIPLCLYMLNLLFHTKLFSILIYVSLAIGILISLFCVGLLSIEFHQDRSINRKYTDIRKKKLSLGNKLYECQSCGNRKITAMDKSCDICGMKFVTERRI
jgi:hypothetical protein